ncbi:MAG: antibiotic biosynthesis monooxygenase [Anaerolineae bacterium]|nr:antibiotic biosynthesis monooxygenase [Anaerolineae bacterium]
MQKDTFSNQSEHIYRVDKFVVPDHAREEFIEKVQATHQLLKQQSGFLQDFVLEQASEPGESHIMTMVEWDSIESIEPAKAAVKAMHQAMNFNSQELFVRLGIKADLGTYKRVGL